jgi:hypothetical protein
MDFGAAVVSADWVALASLWEAPTEYTKIFINRVFQVSADFHLYPGLPTLINSSV